MTTVLWILGASLTGVWCLQTVLFVLSYRIETRGEDSN